MALKLPDSAVPMGDFPVAKAVDIDFDDGENLQEKMDNGTLGGVDGDIVYTTTPIGTVLSFAGLTAPNGYLLCDGGSYAVADYQDLYAVIGNTYGGDSTNFNVPNLVDKFIQGSTISGTEKQAGLPNITGEAWIRVREGSSTGDSIEQTTGAFTRGSSRTYQRASAVADNSGTNSLKIDASRSSSIYGNSDTVQPPALTMAYIIKAFHTNEGVDAPVELEDNVISHINHRVDSKLVEDMSDYINERVEDRVTEVVHRLIEGTEYPTTETCPVGCWYGMYF